MLERLEAADQLAELGARLQIGKVISNAAVAEPSISAASRA
jgi:hypothetical protein